jgi:ketosteroid isomerase-like protein
MTTARETIEKAYAAIASGDGAGFAALLADDVSLHEPDGHPYPGSWHGKEAVLGAFPGIVGALGVQGIDVHQVVDAGEHVIGVIEILCTSKSGAKVVAPALELWSVRDGLITEAKPYYLDVTKLVADLAG